MIGHILTWCLTQVITEGTVKDMGSPKYTTTKQIVKYLKTNSYREIKDIVQNRDQYIQLCQIKDVPSSLL